MFTLATSQAVNFSKSNVAFSANVGSQEQLSLADFLEVQVVERHERYLRLPTFMGKNKNQMFSFIKEQVLKRICGWNMTCLSNAGENSLLKWSHGPYQRIL